MMRITGVLLALCLWGMTQGQNAIATEVTSLKTAGRSFQESTLLKFQTNDVGNRAYDLEGLKRGTIMTIDQDAIHSLINSKNDLITLPLPVSDRAEVKLTLIRHEIFSADFAFYTSADPKTPIDYRPGIHYKGIVEGDPTSIVAISIFNDEIMGLISTSKGNLVLGRIQNDRENSHVLYNDADLDRSSDFLCSTADDGLPYTEDELKPHAGGRDVGDCVRLYIEIDDDIVTQKGGAVPATNYITGLFNQSFVIYTAESVNMSISEILAWTTNSPYTGSTSLQMLQSFEANTGEFNGNVGKLVSYQASGGIAYLDGLCQSNPDWRKCFSSIGSTYANVPTYSWSVMVVTHEVGHVIGSKHTHACVWNGNNTAIDGCAAVEGTCALPPIPPEGGTIMSYCHLQGVGINFNLGFGPQPGNVIRNKVNATNNCTTPCGPPPPPPPPAYCASNGTNSSYEFINKVVLGTINNTSGNNSGYGNYISLSTNLTKGTAYTINLTPGFSGSSYNEYWRVWIDYNGDLDWADASEQVGQGSGTAAINVTFTVPANNSSVTTRMRVSMQYNAYPPVCGSFTYGEVEDYTVVIVPVSGATCSDGIQNQGETGVDCGGPCPACPTCSDGIQNQGETGVDCGGPCPACPPAPSCSDGIQNQGETGIDCGGPCPACPPGGGTIILASYFETGWDSWLDGGSDVARVQSANSYEGQYSIRIADNSNSQSAMTSPAFNLSTATGLQITFNFKAISMESGEDFWVRYKNGNGSWVTIGSFVSGTNFNNNTFYVTTVTVPNFVPTTSGSFRITCDASDDSDQVYIDAVIITKFTGGGLVEAGMMIEEVPAPAKPQPVSDITNPDDEKELVVYPNPVVDFLNLSFNGEIGHVRVINLDGRDMKIAMADNAKKLIDISQLATGIYFIWIESEGKWYPSKFSKL